ncbi:unnamed protein product [Pocillopora meandrina]|uniref:Uncharacterized protein n=1 Tax=Pocillopora meandrina TaxID=46732 RepID=A0AAU9XMM3_9CNID|nr:unnamed protein product [Pocillopora meandrina]
MRNCELRITEQLLVSLGMFAHDCGSLKDCNAVLSDYGPDSMKERERIVKNVFTSQGQQNASILENIDKIITHSLPLQNLKFFFFKNKDIAETYLLNQLTFCVKMVQVHSSS